MLANRQPLLANNGQWRAETDNKNWRHLEAGAGASRGMNQTQHQQIQYPRNLTMAEEERTSQGPFVFGVHGPCQYPARSRYQADYASYDDAEQNSVIDNNESNNLYCDRNKVCVKPKGVRSRKGMFSIKDNRDKRLAKVKDNGCCKSKNRIKCVLVGDGAVGKTSLITSYAQNHFQYDYKPTTFDNYNVVVEVDDRPISVEICDTAGLDSLEGLRELCYPGTDVIILCFSVVKPESFRSIVNRWAPGVAAIKAPLILVGTQCDLRDNYRIINDLRLQGENPVSESEAKILAERLKAPYIETSSKTRNRLKDAFDAAILATLPVKKKKKPLWKQLLCLS